MVRKRSTVRVRQRLFKSAANRAFLFNIFERWESQAALEFFRSSGPDTEQRPAMLTVSVQEHDIADMRLVFGQEAE